VTPMFRPSRETRGPDPFLQWKIVIFIIGALVGLVGVATENRWLIWIGVAVLLSGVLLRTFGRRAS
jgi:1,4-dihydroxy-2-naphthoate octaprenyltransferase